MIEEEARVNKREILLLTCDESPRETGDMGELTSFDLKTTIMNSISSIFTNFSEVTIYVPFLPSFNCHFTIH